MKNIVLPCEPGQTVYLTCYGIVTQARVDKVKMDMGVRSSARCFETVDGIGQREVFCWDEMGKTVFDTQEEACAAMRETEAFRTAEGGLNRAYTSDQTKMV